LAPGIAKEMMKIIAGINANGVSVLFIEQNVQVALSMSQRAYILESGRLVLTGEPDELLNSSEVKRIFLGG
jgi:branched-chain amino acid transport system ATP-binding protein